MTQRDSFPPETQREPERALEPPPSGAAPLPLHFIAVDLAEDMGALLVAEVERLLACWAEFDRLYPDE